MTSLCYSVYSTNEYLYRCTVDGYQKKIWNKQNRLYILQILDELKDFYKSSVRAITYWKWILYRCSVWFRASKGRRSCSINRSASVSCTHYIVKRFQWKALLALQTVLWNIWNFFSQCRVASPTTCKNLIGKFQ